MHRLLSWLRYLWRGVPKHVDKHDPKTPWSDPKHNVWGDIQEFIERERRRDPADTCDTGIRGFEPSVVIEDEVQEFETNQVSYLAEPKPEGWVSPDELVKQIKRDPTPGVYNPDGITARDLMTDEEQALWADIEGGKPKHPPIAYPPPAEQTTQQWVTSRLEELTGGLTRHPMDVTNYPTPPTEADLAARAMFNGPTAFPVPRAMFSHGYSMRYLGELKARAERKDRTLTAEELMGLRARGLA